MKEDTANTNNIILYSTGCPKCNVLKKKLDQKNIQYTEVNDVKEMLKLNIATAPVLSVDNTLYDFVSAVQYINSI